LQTLVNLIPGGCVAGVPLILCSAAVTLLYCGKLVWKRIIDSLEERPSRHRIISDEQNE
jgi:anterior pharynx defective protein 1